MILQPVTPGSYSLFHEGIVHFIIELHESFDSGIVLLHLIEKAISWWHEENIDVLPEMVSVLPQGV